MELFHYTGVTLLHCILTSEGINKGYLQLSDSKVLQGHSWYTSSSLPYGHGLCNGTEILNESEKKLTRLVSNLPENHGVYKLSNKQQIRIRIDAGWISSQPDFHKFTDLMTLYEQPADYALGLGLTGLLGNRSLSDKEWVALLVNPGLQHENWYVHTGTLPPERILSVESMEASGEYVPYNFEIHGREVMNGAGLFTPSLDAILALNSKTKYHYSQGDIIVVCNHRDAPPHIIFRSRYFTIIVSLDTLELLEFKGNSELILSDSDAIVLWLKENKQDLMKLWGQAKDSFHRYKD